MASKKAGAPKPRTRKATTKPKEEIPTPKSNLIKLKKPTSILGKPVKFTLKEFFIALTKTARDGMTGKWEDLPLDALEILKSLNLETQIGELAWILINVALRQALAELARESAGYLRRIPPKEDPRLWKNMNVELLEGQEVGEGFFEHPADFPPLREIQAIFEQWLISHDIGENKEATSARAASVAARLPSFFVNALDAEWSHKPDTYKKLLQTVKTPFAKASTRELDWRRYESWLNRQIDERIFEETFSLRQVYIPLRACYRKGRRKDNLQRIGIGPDSGPSDEPPGTTSVVVDLADHLDEWVERADPTDAVRIICGGPGSGKSCFEKFFALHVAESGARVLYIPLHQFDHTDDLAESVGRFARQTDAFQHNPMDEVEGESRLLLIFDGLDELANQGKVGAEAARRFAEEVDRTVRRRNVRQLRLQVLIGGRDLAVQSVESEFRGEGQVLNVLPYVISSKEDEQEQSYQDPDNLLGTDQRQEWWKKYGVAVGLPYDGLPKELDREGFNDITPQPLLNYLVALSHGRGKLDFKEDVNLNLVYEDLLHAVYNRPYEERGKWPGTVPALGQMEYDDFVRILEEIALATWHGDGRTTTVKEIEAHVKQSGLEHLLEVFQESAKAGVARLLTAFYFRRFGSRPDGDTCFEFTHKSFGEYLCAGRIVRAMRDIADELGKKQDGNYRAWDEANCLKRWTDLCGPTSMDRYLFDFIARQVALAGKEEVLKWQGKYSHLIAWMLREGMPTQLLDPRPSFKEETRQARNAEEALLAALNACARVTGEVSTINWPDECSAGTWIRRMQGQRSGGENTLASRALSFLNLTAQRLDLIDLYGANLKGAILQRSHMEGAALWRAVLRNAHLEAADLKSAHLDMADLKGAHLEGADLKGAYLERAKLRGADLKGADLRGAFLKEAHLEEADLEGAILRRANLEKANLEGANLERWDVKGADLRGAIIDTAAREYAKKAGAVVD